MGWIIGLLAVICCILVLQIARYQMELKHIEQQLCIVEKGSSITVVSNIHHKTFLKLCGTINHMMDSKQKKEAQYKRAENQLKQGISSIAHDIRTPLTSAAGYMQMLETCSVEKRRRYENIVSKRLDELKNMLEELFLYTKVTSNDFEVICESVSVFSILSECMVGLYPVFEEQKVEPLIFFEDENVHVYSNKECLERIFKNIINKALLHGAGGMEIWQHNKEIRFSNSVSKGQEVDTEKMFDRFYKQDAARRESSSGLGLAIAKELVEKMDGRICAQCDNHILSIIITFQK